MARNTLEVDDARRKGRGSCVDFELLVESIHDHAIFMVDPAGIIRSWNRGAERTTGFAADEIIGQHLSVLYPRLDLERGRCDADLSAALSAVVEGGHQTDGWRVRRDGTQFWAHVALTPVHELHDTGGERRHVGFAVVVRDLSAQRAAAQALRQNEEQLRLLVANVKDYAILMLDRTGHVVSWNTGAQRIKGWRAEEILGAHISRFYTAEDVGAGKPERLLREAATSGRVEDEGWRVRKDGTRFWADVTITAVRDASGELRGFAKVTRDLTERRAAQTQLEGRAREQAAVADLGLFALRTRSLGDVLDRAVQVAASVLGAECVDVLEREAEGSRLVLRAGVGWPADLIGSAGVAAEDLPVGRAEPSPLHRERGIVASAHVAIPGEGGGGRSYGILGVHATQPRVFTGAEIDFLRAIATLIGTALARRASERELRHAQERAETARIERAAAEQASRAKDEFLALLGHELRNPLAPIVTALELLKMRGDGDDREHAIIARQVEHLTRLVDDLLDVSRVVRGKLELHLEPRELASVIAKGVEMASPLLEQRQQQFTIDVPRAGLPVLVDPLRLAQVIANLLTNAAKYTPPGGRIALDAHAEGEQIVVAVTDSGMGIAAELLPRVFDLFIQGPRSSDRAEGGLGLGLALVKRIVGLHGGTVTAHSEGPGHGSRFVVHLPRLATDAVAAAPAHPPTLKPPLRSRRVLIVDDNADAADTLAAILASVGHEVEVAADALQALRLASRHTPEIAILDIGLPVIDGYELAGRLRDRHGDALILYAVTGYGQEKDVARARAAGFDRHFVKPVETEKLLDAIERDEPGAGRAEPDQST